MQLQLFNKPPIKQNLSLCETIARAPEYAPSTAEQLLSERYMTQNGMLLIRQQMATAHRLGDWKKYLQMVRYEIDFKKGRITLGHVLRGCMLASF